MSTGFVATKGPRDIFSLGATLTWMVGEGGYIYFTSDPTSGVTVQDAGSLTTQNLNAVTGFDASNLVAVGDGNIVLVTRNGGATWAAPTGGGPSFGVNLNAVAMRGKDEWWVGTAGGRLFYTRDGGSTWTEKSFPGSGTGVVRDIQFPRPQVGYLLHDTAGGLGRVLRSISGGFSWYVAPEGVGSAPANQRLNQLATSKDEVNTVFAAGLATGGADGILLKGSGV
jgi:photosystem II stability/assembly factor-like uncharacterized protein